MSLSKEFLNRCVIFPVTIRRDAEGKKKIEKMPEWKSITKSTIQNPGPNENYAIRTRQLSNLSVIDLDKASGTKSCSIEWWERNMYLLEEHPGILVKSTNGYHLYFDYSPDLIGHTGLFGAGVDIRSDGGIIFCSKGYTVVKENTLPPVPTDFLIKYHEYTQTHGLTNKEDEPPSDQPIDPKLGDIILKYIKKEFADPGQIQIYGNQHMTVLLKSHDCQIAGHRHQSNHQYLVMKRDKCIYKCHDEQCEDSIDYKYPKKVETTMLRVLKPSKDELVKYCNGADKRMAKCLLAMFEDMNENHDIVTLAKDYFFIFDGTRWYEANCTTHILNDALEGMQLEFADMWKKVELEAAEHREASENTDLGVDVCKKASKMLKQLEARAKLLKQCAARCEAEKYANSYKRILAELVEDEDFMERLDTDMTLIAFNDCVLDLTTKKTRPGKATDYISKTVGYDYPEYVPRQDREYVESILHKIYPDPEIWTHVLKVFSLSLSGAKGTEKMYFHTGVGANGKSVMNSIMMAVLGQYAVELEVQRFCRGSVSTGAGNAFLVKARGCRYVSISEPREGCKFDSQTVKMWTLEVILCRQLYSSVVIKLHPNRKLHCFCNAMPSFDGDTGMMRRPEKIPYMSKFKEADQVDKENHVYLMDKSLLSNMDRIIPAMMQILIEHYDNKWDEQAPSIIRNETKEYVEDNNEVGRFLSGVMTKSEDKTDFVLMTHLFEQYETHCNMTRKPRPQRGNFKNQLIAFVDAQRHGVFKDKTTHQQDGKVKTLNNVVKGWKPL
ncbi:hypothetical protein GGF32_006734 [Allomyces javanicus]|nr:hypothetical protein GGF32_006734 [Allomyces javanicus]